MLSRVSRKILVVVIVAAEFLKKESSIEEVDSYKDSYFQHFNLDVNTFPKEMEVFYEGNQLKPGYDFSINPSSVGRKGNLILHEVTAKEALNLDTIRSIVTRVLQTESEEDVALLFDMTIVSSDTVKLLRELTYKLAFYFPIVEVVNDKFTWSVGREERFFPYLKIQEFKINKKGVLFFWKKYFGHHNVIGYIPAKKKCAKTILFTAHYDHLGRMGKDTYFPGANDNASGTAMLFSIAKYFKENPSEFNIMFIAFAGEEAGLVGSKYFVEHPIVKLKKIKFVINLDIMGSGEAGVTVVNGSLFEKMGLLQR